MVEAAYNLISFGPGADPAWLSFRRLFAERPVLALRLFPNDESLSIMDLDQYVRCQIREDMKQLGYVERPLESTFVVVGQVAQARVRFEMIYGPDERYEGVDYFQLVQQIGEWKIVSIAGEILEPSSSDVLRNVRPMLHG